MKTEQDPRTRSPLLGRCVGCDEDLDYCKGNYYLEAYHENLRVDEK